MMVGGGEKLVANIIRSDWINVNFHSVHKKLPSLKRGEWINVNFYEHKKSLFLNDEIGQWQLLRT